MAFLQEETNHFHREDYYRAQIAFEIAKSNSKNPKNFASRYSIKDYLIKFATRNTDKAEAREEVPDDKLVRSKSFWSRYGGNILSKSKKKKPRKK